MRRYEIPSFYANAPENGPCLDLRVSLFDMFDVTLIEDRLEDGLRKASFRTCGIVCSTRIDIELDGDTVRRVNYTDGCNGNTQGVAALIAGMKVDDAIRRLDGINCNGRGTSCPDQLARALKSLR